MTDEKTIPDTIGALAKELRAAERRQEKRDALILAEVRTHGKAIAELAKQLADVNARVDNHDQWEREQRNGADPSDNDPEVIE